MIILDACAAVEMIRDTERGKGFAALMLEGERAAAPSLFEVEVRNALWKYVRHGLLTETDAVGYAADADALIDVLLPMHDYLDEAFLEAVNRNHSVYDMLYLCAARRNDATLFTADRKLMRACEEAGVDCVCEAPF